MRPGPDHPLSSTLGETERTVLLALARASIRHRLGVGPAPEIPTSGLYDAPRGAFVTLRRDGALRGCIGTLAPRDPLALAVVRMSAAAATEDPRFEPVRPEEIEALRISISALTPLRPLAGPEELVVGRDGVAVQLGWSRGTLLPAVAVEQGWTAEELVRQTCIKAGLWPEAWKDPKAVLEAYSAEEFGE